MASQEQFRKASVLEVFDPRAGDDFQFGIDHSGKTIFSSRDSDCAVIRASWMQGWVASSIPFRVFSPTVVNLILEKTADVGFFCVCPGASLRSIVSPFSGEAHQCGDSLLSQFHHDEQNVAWFLREVSTRGSYEEWIIGSAKQEINCEDVDSTNLESRSLDLFFFLSHFSVIGSVWSFNFDTSEMLAIFRTFDGYEDIVSKIVDNIRGGASFGDNREDERI